MNKRILAIAPRIARVSLAVGLFLSVKIPLAATPLSAHVYFGPASPTALLDVVKARGVQFEPFFQFSLGGAWQFASLGPYFGSGIEATLTKHTESWDLFSASSALWIRWTLLPWSRWVRSGFKAGAGLSYATDYLVAETAHIARSSKLLFHVILEFDVFPFGELPWGFLLRVHHRSGIFGLFEGVVGGSDFICLGLRFAY